MKKLYSIRLLFLALIMIFGSIFYVMGAPVSLMVDPAIDTTAPFSYLSKPCTTIGVSGGLRASQVTYDGAIYTGAAELCFFYGEKLTPVMVRQKELVDGWIPIVTYSWKDGDVLYTIEAFGATLDGNPSSNTINFISVEMKNESAKKSNAYFATALRFTGKDHRFEGLKQFIFLPDWVYEISDTCVIRDDKMLLVFPAGCSKESVPGTAYTAPFKGSDYKITERAETCLLKYSYDLSPGEKKVLRFKMPLLPVLRKDKKQMEKIEAADYDHYRKRTVDFWNSILSQGAQITIPEEKVLNTHRASLMYDYLAIRQHEGNWIQGVNKLQYNGFWLRDGAYITRTYDMLGHHETAELCLNYFLTHQRPDGCFMSQRGQYDGFGQALFALGQHYLMTGDMEYARRVYPHFAPAIEWLKKARAEDEFHLMPATNARDNELIIGHYTGHNFWALLGVRTAARMAKALGHTDDYAVFMNEYRDFYKAFMKKLEEVAGKDGYIPPGLDAEGGQDWGNLLGVYPAEVLDPLDPRISTTLEKMQNEKYEEGIMTYSGRLHHYLTVKASQNYVVRLEQEQALEDFYHIVLHTGTTQEGFEFGAIPWGERDVYSNYPPHGWCAAMMNALLRNMLIQERGGEGGLQRRDIHLFSVVSPAWAIPGEQISLQNMPTEIGALSASLEFNENGAELKVQTNFRENPASIIFHIPYFVELQNVESDASQSKRNGTEIIFSPDITHATFTWKMKETSPMSYAHVVDAYKREYAEKYKERAASGKKPYHVEAPPMLTAEERKNLFDSRYSKQAQGIAVGKPVKVSGGTEEGHPPELAVDGNAVDRNESSWWAAPPTPRWLQVDLEQPTIIDRIHVYPYWDGTRFYQYRVETSLDGKDWTQVVDMSENTAPAKETGDLHTFQPRKVRYVRVNMLHNSANPSVHLVEVKVFKPSKEEE